MTAIERTCCPQCGRPLKIDFRFSLILKQAGMVFTHEDLCLNFSRLSATKRSIPVKMTKSQWRICAVLVGAEGQAVRRDDLASIISGVDYASTRSVDTQVAVIRSKIGPYIRTLPCLGYAWDSLGNSALHRRPARRRGKKRRKV
jgi:DNA-binding response OmpR family regulator